MYMGFIEWPVYDGGDPVVFTHDDVPSLMRVCAEFLKGYVPEEKADQFPELNPEVHASVKEWLQASNDVDDWAYLTIFKSAGPGKRAEWVPHTDMAKEGYPTYREMMARV